MKNPRFVDFHTKNVPPQERAWLIRPPARTTRRWSEARLIGQAVELRKRTCLACDQAHVAMGTPVRCRNCGCDLAAKLAAAASVCPLNRWPAANRVAILQPGRAGDLLTLIPAFKWLAERGQKLTLFVDPRYAPICDRFSWLRQIEISYAAGPWEPAKAIAAGEHGEFDEVRITTIGWDRPEGKDFIAAQWERTACPSELIDQLPLDLSECRNHDAEAALVRDTIGEHRGPLVLFNTTHFEPKGRQAGFEAGPELLQFLRGRFSAVRFIDLGRIRAASIFDLLGLYEQASCLINSDNGTLHLGYATGTPTIGLVLDDPLQASRRRPHWIERMTYSEAQQPGGFELLALRLTHALKGKL